ncbi:MAG: UDP-N-acetylenolpyruvoylglucosamine reductase [Elusimicrobia bacterium GWA2_69_24]|nr:MAG: UDP-N-acetylenolpyruvoylglucosamine reductase [Elusimicrobia bacterium GWA2_69_24]HBL15447.1 UDP-N-acetylenolpyruvoylglucosamine reductase [Elusimicrobiota bacterium]
MSVPTSFTLLERVPLAEHTSIRLGGPARRLAVCADEAQVRECLDWARGEGAPVQVLGGGSNILFPDSGFAGVVLKVGIPGLEFSEESESWLVRAGAGESWDGLAAAAAARGLQGVECLSGIPGSVGATPVQNVGAYGQELADTLVSVSALDRETLETAVLDRGECGLGYRTSRFKGVDRDRWIILAITLRLRPGGRPALGYPELAAQFPGGGVPEGEAGIAAVREAVLRLRRSKSMVLDPGDPDSVSVGSFFTNPILGAEALAAFRKRVRNEGDGMAPPAFTAVGGTKIPAAWLIEKAGFPKGLRKGGVGVSSKHALALVNYGGSTAELRSLASDIQAAVLARFGVSLELEPVVVR